MHEEPDAQELNERLEVIEAMLAEGRRSTERWGWAFLLWGAAYVAAMAWAHWAGSGSPAWPVTMVLAAAATVLIAVIRRDNAPATAAGRAVISLWAGVGTGMVVLFFGLGLTGRLEAHVFVAGIGAMLGAANAVSGMILRWRMQRACGIVWWAVAVLACFGSAGQALTALLGGVVVCLILFGAYAMALDARNARRSQLAHG